MYSRFPSQLARRLRHPGGRAGQADAADTGRTILL